MKNNNLQMADLIMDVVPKMMQIMREEMRHGRGERLTVPQFRVLASINRGITKNKVIAEMLGVSEAAISRMIDNLVAEGLIKKGVSKIDKRNAKLSLSSEGEKLYLQIRSEARMSLKEKIDTDDSIDSQAVVSGLIALDKFIMDLRKKVELE